MTRDDTVDTLAKYLWSNSRHRADTWEGSADKPKLLAQAGKGGHC